MKGRAESESDLMAVLELEDFGFTMTSTHFLDILNVNVSKSPLSASYSIHPSSILHQLTTPSPACCMEATIL